MYLRSRYRVIVGDMKLIVSVGAGEDGEDGEEDSFWQISTKKYNFSV
jgi:hypothetical protein